MAVSAVLERTLGTYDNVIVTAKVNNERKEKLAVAISEISEALEAAQNVYTLMYNLSKELAITAANYRENRKTELEAETKRALALIFPWEGFDVKIDWSELKGTQQAQILTALKDEDGNKKWYPPKNVHGEFAKQIIAFTTLYNMAVMLGAEFFGSDEALNSGDSESLGDVRPLLEKLNESLQLIAIEHKESFYNTVARREIALSKVPGDSGEKSGYVEIVSTQDYEAGEREQ